MHSCCCYNVGPIFYPKSCWNFKSFSDQMEWSKTIHHLATYWTCHHWTRAKKIGPPLEPPSPVQLRRRQLTQRGELAGARYGLCRRCEKESRRLGASAPLNLCKRDKEEFLCPLLQVYPSTTKLGQCCSQTKKTRASLFLITKKHAQAEVVIISFSNFFVVLKSQSLRELGLILGRSNNKAS